MRRFCDSCRETVISISLMANFRVNARSIEAIPFDMAPIVNGHREGGGR
jgi:hypothetical protein